MDIESVSNQDQTLIRIGEKLVAGIVNSEAWHGIYIWCNVNGTYKYLGDIVFKTNEDGSTTWHVLPMASKKILDKAAELFAKQVKSFDPKTDSPGVYFLSHPI
ncbi:MAG: hypothetical protein WC460_02115 [Patescibacteria group bacterium]